MQLLRRSRSAGFRWTAIAAALVVVVGIVANPWVGHIRFGHHHGASTLPTIVGSLVMAGALLDRWRPMRWLVRLTTGFGALTYGGLAVAGYRPTLAYAATAAACAAIYVILGSAPVRRWFRMPSSEWGSGAEEMPIPPEPTMLPPEKLDGVWAARTRPEADPARDGRV